MNFRIYFILLITYQFINVILQIHDILSITFSKYDEFCKSLVNVTVFEFNCKI